jgi:D-alanine-D-alanine ligase
LKIALITGGLSAEREVSLTSGKSILKGLRENGHTVKVIDPIYGAESVAEEYIFRDKLSKDYPDFSILDKLKNESYRKFLSCINSDLFDDIDIAFIALHGKYGEDGRIQAMLDAGSIKYTGSGMLASAISMDKDFSKIIFKNAGIPTPEWLSLKKNEQISFSDVLEYIGKDYVIKPSDEGSTVGISVMHSVDEKEFFNALELSFRYSDKILIEKYIKGKEITIPVIDNKAFPVLEIKPKDGYYDYEHKYSSGMTEYICPVDFDDEIINAVEDYGLRAFNAVGAEVYSRIDFLLAEDNRPYCLEINTLPGMTALSLVPKSAKVNGIDFNELLELIINLSIKKYK